MYNVKILPQELIIPDKQIWEYFLDFQQRNLSKLEKVHAFQKQNASNELNIFFLNKIEEDFLR